MKRPEGGEWEADLTDEWKTSPRPGWEYRGIGPYRNRYWAYSKEKMRQFVHEGRLHYVSTGMPRYKRYLDEMPGVSLQDLWMDIFPALGKERVGYPTQKPLALMERIIQSSSNPGDIVLDPFCGCATTLVAAEALSRKWIGIDLSSLAAKLVKRRLRDQHGLFGQIIDRTDVPARTDLGDEVVLAEYKGTLYGEQEGNCNGCRHHFQYRNLAVDHIHPRAKGGRNHAHNLQLLCTSCNSAKGVGTQEALVAKLKEQGVRYDYGGSR
ncbi:DNA methyltransferase [Candidatus Palauibacter sp.]|uniref:DNA methyltransferase n=1 Tax=Candidatus Palauibacter sp. TaxID=3101350 RepID=UPI003B59A2D2